MIRYGSERNTATLESMVESSLMRAFADLKLAPIADLTSTCLPDRTQARRQAT